MKRINEFIAAARNAINIYESNISWEIKYHLIFSDEVSGVLNKIPLDYYDPDTSYQEDVMAYIAAIKEKLVEIESIGGLDGRV